MSSFAFALNLCAVAVLIALTPGGAAMAEDPPFASRAQAMRYLSHALPKATAANPTYRTTSDGTISRWLTKDVRFRKAKGGAVSVTMRESFAQVKGEKKTEGSHEAKFSLADVAITAFTEPGDVTPSGEPSCGVLFTCAKPGCIAAVWGAKASHGDKTDISIQDKATLDQILAAFRRLQAP